ncbi:ABC transporter substrate-binding protein [Nocardia sp. CC227C]|uniref:ABC transporter substrate-binding protein n=1 Tax=Nocardia sp. CC227C TaxID=3044562 RepID=UPI00278BDB27|nr:ABC transporter substrate-binding protein [Nocardia sp. CC227C]
MSGRSEPIVPPRPPWHRWAWIGGATVLVVIALVAAFVVVPAVREALRSCGPGVTRTGESGECTGVTDGSYVFDPELEHVQRLIHAENQDVARRDENHVSVAVLLPMTLRPGDTVTMPWVRHQLQGAYLAQHTANHDVGASGGRPLVRLLLANPGSGLRDWRRVLGELHRRTDGDRIVAVTGIGLSTENARAAMEQLSESRMPMFASTLTADDLTGIRGFVRVSPTNSTQARAVADYLKPQHRTALLVQDRNPRDHYPQTLATAFAEGFVDAGHRLAAPTEWYLSDAGSVANTFSLMLPNICAAKPDVLYFAGRGAHATLLIKALAERQCRDVPMTVATADDLSQYAAQDDALRRALESGVRVVYTGLAHPRAWQVRPEDFSAGAMAKFTDSCDTCYPTLFPGDSLDDGVAIIAYDAVQAAAWSIRSAAGDTVADVGATDVLQVMNRLHGRSAISGAGGPIAFDEVGNPIGKPIPVLELRVDAGPGFAGLSWPDR